MGIIKDYMNQTRKPEGILGKMMILGMNMGHAGMAKWGTSFLDVRPPEQIVDLGCGGGSNLMALALKYPGSTVTGVDYSPLSVKKSKEKNKVLIAAGKCSVQQGDVSALTLADETFDLATAYETIYFWPGLEKCFAEVARVLKPDGTFMIVNEADGYDAATKKYEDIIDGMKVYTPGQIEEALLTAGFEDVKSYHHGKKPWITVIAKKKKQ